MRLWPLKGKLTMPEPARDYLLRAALLQQVDSVLERRVTVLQAPAGFGKTTVLADAGRRKQKQGVAVAWLSVDEDDAPSVLGAYIACALELAGLELTAAEAFEIWSATPVAQQLGMLVRAVELQECPCLLILDEVDCLPRRSLGLLERLLKRGPANLHVAMALRSNPGIDFTAHVLGGSGAVVGTEQFRFSKAEIARFFRGELSRRELATLAERTAGWPVALTVYRGVRAGAAAPERVDAERLGADFVDLHVLGALPDQIRRDLLDLAVFDRIEADLVDEVLGSSDARVRVEKQPALEGFLLPVGKEKQVVVRRLHPLVRERCLDLLAVENPDRKRSLHAGLARVVARRWRLTYAWRHAQAAGDGQLVGELVEGAGMFRMWLRDGMASLLSADCLLSPEITASHPRCALLRVAAFRLSSRFVEALELFESVVRATDNFKRDRAGGDVDGLRVDRVFAQTVLAGGSARLLHDELDALPVAGSAVGSVDQARMKHIVLCVSCFERADFAQSRRHALLARSCLSPDMRYGDIFIDICLGMGAMAQGRVQEASDLYRRSRQSARRHFPADACLALCADLVTMELDLERNREKAIQQRKPKSLAGLRGAWSELYAAAVASSAEWTSMRHGGESAVRLVSEALAEMEPTDSPSLIRHLSALLASYLVEVGRVDEAAQLWGERELPSGVFELLDLDTQSWRTMEALSSARVRLLTARGGFAAADVVVTELCGRASARGLTRTLLRGLALSIVVAYRAGEAGTAQQRLVEFLRRVGGVGYIRPLVRIRGVGLVVLRGLMGTNLDADLRESAASMLRHLDERPQEPAATFSPRELQVLGQLRIGRENREIASSMGISEAGVRFHLRNIYGKLGVQQRVDAVHKAQSLEVPS